MPVDRAALARKLSAISKSGLSIYDLLEGRPDLFLTIEELEAALGATLVGLSLANLPIRTRSKVFKSAVCKALGYPVPETFRKTQPRFPSQDFDTYVQKSNNLQIWNEEVAPTRRYVIARPNENGVITAVRVVTGDAIAALDTTGTLTQKYQARRQQGRDGSRLVSARDTEVFRQEFAPADSVADLHRTTAVGHPQRGSVLSTRGIFVLLSGLIGLATPDPGMDQERSRGAGLQKAVCAALGLGGYADKGQWPDILSQALELKLQTSPTIDLGLVLPSGTEPAQEVSPRIRHCDIRYAVFYGTKQSDGTVRLTSVIVVTGQDFFNEFEQFGGKEINAKLQIPLPSSFFD